MEKRDRNINVRVKQITKRMLKEIMIVENRYRESWDQVSQADIIEGLIVAHYKTLKEREETQ